MALSLNTLQPVNTLPQANSETVEHYLVKPLIITTEITKEPELKKPIKYESNLIIVKADSTNNCVEFAKRMTGITRTMGAGGRLAIQDKVPEVGAIGSLNGTAHAVVVKEVDGEMITFTESNQIKGFITQRTLPLSSFIGFIHN